MHRVAKIATTAPCVALAFLFSAHVADAQTMDYGSLEQLFGEPVTTSATGSPQRATEVPANMTIVTADEIRRSGARDIPSVLSHVGGVDLMQWANDDADISIRGYNEAYASRTLVLIDGRQVYADYYGLTPWSALPVELGAIRQIEIVRGPNAALFGFNAVGGVINIITNNPRYDEVNTVTVRAGTHGLAEVSAVATVKLGNVGALRLTGGLRSQNEFSTPIPAAMSGLPRVQTRRASLEADVVFTLNDNTELDFDVSHTRAPRNEVVPGYLYEGVRFETNSILGRLTADTDVGLLKLTAYGNWLTQHTVEEPVFGTFAFSNFVAVVQAEDVFNIGTDHTVRLAAEYRHAASDTTPVLGGTVFYDVVSVSGMWNWRVTPFLSLTNAVRFDHLALGRDGSVPAGYPFTNADWNRVIDDYSFNSGLVWKADDTNTLRLIASRGVQLPSLSNIGAFVLETPFIRLTGVPTLKPTTVSNYELAWDRGLPSISAQLRAGIFYQITENVVSTSGGAIFTPTSFYVTTSNLGDSKAEGLETSISGLIGDEWRWSLSYRAEFVADDLLPFAVGGTTFIDYEHTTPKHAVKASLGWTTGAWEADAYLGYQSNTSGLRLVGIGTELVPVGAFTTLDGRIAYRLADWATIAVSGKNLLQSTQRQTSGPEVERQVFATLGVNF